MTPGGEARGSILAGPERGEHPAKKQKLETAEMSFNPTAPHKGRSAADPDSPPAQAVPRCGADPAQPSSGNRGHHGVRVPSACACAALPPYRSLAFSVISG